MAREPSVGHRVAVTGWFDKAMRGRKVLLTSGFPKELPMLTQILPYSLGFFLALAMCYAARYMPYEKEYRYWWVIAVFVVASFPSMPLSMGDIAGFWYEIYAVVALGLLLVVSWRPGLWLALVFFAHGCWDLVHISAHLTIQKPLWVSQLCVPYDWMIAAYLVWRTRSSRVS